MSRSMAMLSPSSSRPAYVVSPVRIRVSQLVPAVASGVRGHPELRDAARATDAELRAGRGWDVPAISPRLDVVAMPHRDYWIMAYGRRTRFAIAGFTPPGAKRRTRLWLLPPQDPAPDVEPRFGRALGYLYLSVRPGASHSFTRTLLSLSLRLNATAHLNSAEATVRSIDAAVERELRRADAMTRSVPGGGPGLGKRI